LRDYIHYLCRENARLREKIRRRDILLFQHGAMLEAPCFRCGYNAVGYYQPRYHKCAELHLKYYERSEEE
jgi:hypothetical protein